MPYADLLIENARILTMDPDGPRAGALAIRGDTLLSLGPGDRLDDLAGPGTRRFDAQGCTVLPGLVESHLHLFIGAYGLRLLHLDGVTGADALAECLAAYATQRPDEALLLCKGTDYNLFGPGVQTTRQMLDAVLPDRPLLCLSADHHTAWANTIALERAGLLQGRALPPGHEVVMATDGTAAGELREHAAFDPVMALRSSGGRESLGFAGLEPGPGLSAAARAEDLQVLREGLRHCASYGFTSLHNMDGNRYQLELLHQLDRDGDLLCRTQVPFLLTPEKPLDSLAEASAMQRDFRSPRLRSGRVKMFMDGVIDSGTAVLVEDYADRPGWRGAALHDTARFAAACIEADRRGLQISVHAIGDGAVRRVLDGYQAARQANGPRDSRHRIEHIELLHPDDFPRLKALGVVASMQPPHPPGALNFPLEPWLSRTGPARWPHGFPVRALRAAGVPQAFASDWPISPLDPMLGVRAAMTRPRWSEACPDNRLSLAEALHGYTLGGAHAGFDENRLGMLRAGRQADVVVMDCDLESCDPEQIGTARAALTLCAGTLTWEV